MTISPRMLLPACLAAALSLQWAAPARAQQLPSLPSAAELAAAEPLLARGQVTVVEPSAGKNRAGVLLLSLVNAPAATSYRIVADPAGYPEFMGTLEKIDVLSRRKNALVYSYRWRTGGLPWQGKCAASLAPPGDIAIRQISGDFGTNQMRWHFYPRSNDTTLVAEAASFDLARSHRLLRWLLSRGAAMPEALSLTVSTVLLEGSRAHAEKLSGRGSHRATRPATPPTGFTAAELVRLAPLLARGTLVLVERESDGSFRQALVAETVDAPLTTVVALLGDPESWPQAVPVMNELEVTSNSGSATRNVRISMNLSIFTVEGEARISTTADGADLRGTAGGLQRTALRFTATALPDGRTVLQTVGHTDMARASFLLRRLVGREPAFAHGLNSAAQLLLVRGLAAEAERRSSR